MKVSVVLPYYNHWDLSHSLLFDIFTWCRSVDEVVLLDNGSTEHDGHAWWTKGGMLPIKYVRLEENVGFLRGANRGMQEATGDILILISNDVSVKDDIVSQIVRLLGETSQRVIVGGRYLGFDTGWNCFEGKIYPYLEGWLLACHKEHWQELGGFDEQFCPNDFEDVDFSTNAIGKGFAMVGLENPKITHAGGGTLGFSDERRALTERNREKFREKWVK